MKRLYIQSIAIALTVFSCMPSLSEKNSDESTTTDKKYKFQVLYPQPTDTIQFDLDYAEHLHLLDSLMGYSEQDKPYYITKMDREVYGSPAAFYQMFTMSFATREELETTINSKEMGEAGKDAMSISSGGAPIVLIGKDE